MPKIKIDKEKCIGCGSCAGLCPQVFEIGEDGKSHVINENGKCDLQEAIDSCPVEAISLEK
jgi:ferredoxin